MNWFQAKAYLQYIFKKKQWRDKDFQSPLAQNIAQDVFYEVHPYYHFVVINDIRNDLLQSKKQIEISDFGAGSKKFRSNKRSIKNLVKYNASSQQQGEIISRLISYFKPQNIIELGTSLGIGTLYLALPNSTTPVYTIEGCANIAKEAQENFSIAKSIHIHQNVGAFETELPKVISKIKEVDFVYFDGHHNYQATINYFNICLSKASESAIFIFDDIYWSEGMAKAWSEIKQHPDVSLTFDLFRFGVAILKIQKNKEHYIIKRV